MTGFRGSIHLLRLEITHFIRPLQEPRLFHKTMVNIYFCPVRLMRVVLLLVVLVACWYDITHLISRLAVLLLNSFYRRPKTCQHCVEASQRSVVCLS